MSIKNAIVLHLFIFVLSNIYYTSIFAQVHADFFATNASGCSPIRVTFKDLSTGGATSWKWDLGNGTVSMQQNPSTTYFTPGNYTIKLVASNSDGSDVVIKKNYISVFAHPISAFNVSPMSGCYPLNVSFTDKSSASTKNISNWQWDFGDGNITNLQSPSHIYQNSGMFNVSLTVKDSNGCSQTLTRTNLINVNEGVHANFNNSSPPSCTVPVTVDFSNQSTGNNISSYLWDFGDGKTSTSINPSHVYTGTGIYTVSLKVYNTNGCSDVKTQSPLYIGVAKAGFAIPSNVCSNVAIGIVNTSLPIYGMTHSNWTFSDGTTDSVINPVKYFKTPGNYTVKLHVDFGGCSDDIIQSVRVLADPKPTFTADIKTACQAPLTVAFTNTTAARLAQSWDFGDGTTSTLANPTHTYTALGNYTVKLVVTSESGCLGSVSLPSFINVGPSKIVKINKAPIKGCVPYTANLSAVLSPILPGTTYLWNFGDGTTSTLPNPSHIYAIEGTYNLQLIVTTSTGCSDTLTMTKGVVVGNKPKANFLAAPLISCPDSPVNFTNLSTGGPESYLWFFGDTGFSTDENPIHNYGDTGYNTATLIATRSGCYDTLIKPYYVYIYPPVALYADSVDCSNQHQHYFIDHTIGALTFKWDFGDGDSSTLHSPSHFYKDTGRYAVTLYVTNKMCKHHRVRPLYVLDKDVNFTMIDSVGCRSTKKQFLSTSNPNYILSYLWNFGNGTTEYDTTFSPVSHNYDSSGTYRATLKIKSLNNCADSITKPIIISNNGPKANYSIPPNICINSTVVFNDSSKTNTENKIVQWTWDFGDSSLPYSFTAPPFSHVYAKAATYNVMLVVANSAGCSDTLTRINAVHVNWPIADFTVQDQDTLKCLNSGVQFWNRSSSNIVSFLWDFGDGVKSNLSNPIHSYAVKGNYNINLNVVDMAGCTNAITKSNFVDIANSKALFSISDSFTQCPPLFVSFANTSVNLLQANWNFGDGNTSTILTPSHTYTNAGVFNIKLLVTGNGGCTDTLIKHVVIKGPSGTFTYGPIAGCSPLLVHFLSTGTNTYSYTWDFNDGVTFLGTDSTIDHLFTLPNDYQPKIILADSNGCKIPIYGTETIVVKKLVSHIDKLDNFIICGTASVSFTDSTITNDLVTSYLWSFGDGQTSTLQNPQHSYATSGFYNVNYKVTSAMGCTSSDTLSVPIKVVSSPKIVLSGANNVCQLGKVQYNVQWQNQDTSTIYWHWDFGNRETSITQVPLIQSFTGLGPYAIMVIATNGSGCKDTAQQTLSIWPTPPVVAGKNKFICLGKSDLLAATGAQTYVWETNETLSCSNCYNPIATPVTAQIYKVVGTDIHGCSAEDSVLIQVKYPFKITTSIGDTLCAGQSYRLGALGAESYKWTPSQYLSANNIANPLVTPLSSTNYRVIGADTIGCFYDTGYAYIMVYPVPIINISETKISVTAGNSVNIHSFVSPDVTHLHWSPALWLSCVNCTDPVVSPKQSTTYTITAINGGGCTTKDTINIAVLCNNGNIFIPNTFSPNGDGTNDVFYPRGKGIYGIKSMRVFSRWGQLVFEKTSFQANDRSSGWDGTFSGTKMTNDVFVYAIEVICDNNELFTFKGNVTLIR